ncbi:MAG: hypothetical protein EOO03_08810 [Chitinophagaceae bacterium]|nr:MAG: hypothetical protein EOO03_08810 [Chitinophagaceae bacterium]
MKNNLSTIVVAVGVALTSMNATGRPVVQNSQQNIAWATDAKEIINDIITTVGLKQNFSIMESAAVPNAAAVIYKGERVIAYNPRFVADINTVAGNKWAAVSILAHEIGHHLNGHTLLSSGSEPALELEADEFSGFVLRKMGASLAQAQAAMKIAAGFKQSHTHPAQPGRLLAIAKGWNNAVSVPQNLAKYNEPEPGTNSSTIAAATKNLEVYTRPQATNAVQTSNTAFENSGNIIAKIDFPSDQSASFYVTRGFNVVKLQNNQLFLLEKMLPTTSREFPYVLRNAANKDLFIHQSGKILTAERILAGYLKLKTG